jgi:hypothetical protein
MAFPQNFKKKAPVGLDKSKPLMIDDPADEMAGSTAAEPDGDESYIDGIMGQDMMGGEGDMGAQDPLAEALTTAGFEVDPDKLAQIQAILTAPAKGPDVAAGLGKVGAGAPAAIPPGKLPV